MSVTPPSSPAPIESWEVLDLLTSLVQKSLVVYEEDEQGQGRYRLLETVRQYSRDRLREADEAAGVRGRHLEWCLALTERRSPGESHGARLQRLGREHDNLRAALAWSEAEGHVEAGLRLVETLGWFWFVRGYAREGREHLAGLLALPGAQDRTAARGEALRDAGRLAYYQGDFGAAGALFTESLAIKRELGDTEGIAWLLRWLGWVASFQADYGAARGRFEESLSIFRELENEEGVAWSLNGLGTIARDQGDFGAARALLEESLSTFRELGQHWGIAHTLCYLGKAAHDQKDYRAAQTLLEEGIAIYRELGVKPGIASSPLGCLGSVTHHLGDYQAARALFAESLTIHRELGHEPGIVKDLEGLGTLAVARSQYERAARLFGAAAELRELMGTPLPPVERAEHDRSAAAVHTALGEAAFAAAWAEGRAMSLEQAITYALEDA